MVKEAAGQRLESLGYTFDANLDGWVIGFVIDKVSNLIKNETNLSEIPEGLFEVAVDMVVGEFLLAKKASGNLAGFAVDLNGLLLEKNAQGDTTLGFAVDKVMSAEERLDAVIEHLINYGKPQFTAFRRFRW